MVAIAAITMAAPAAHYATLGVWSLQAAVIWGLCAIYFPSAVFYLKVRIGSVSRKRAHDLSRVWWQCATYHALLALVVVALAAGTPLGPALVLAYLAVLLRAAWYLVRPSQVLSLKRIGKLELAYSATFLTFLIIAMR
jgi:hypothetical protein